MLKNILYVGEIGLRTARTIGFLLSLGLFLGLSAVLHGQVASAPLLSLDDAISIALRDNRMIRNSTMEVEKFEFRLNSTRSRRLPEFGVSAIGSELLKPIDFEFRKGTFGVFPGIGAVPGTDTSIRTAARPNIYLMGSVSQPLTQQYKIGLNIRMLEIARDVAREETRLQRQRTANEVRSVYYSLVAAQSATEAARQSVETLREVERVALHYSTEQALLKADLLAVQSRLARQEYQLIVAQNAAANLAEQLNGLLARDLRTTFRVTNPPEVPQDDFSLDVAQLRALENRPELRQIKLKVQLANYDRHLAESAYIPDISLSVRYFGLRTIEMVPSNVAVAGFYLSWEPFDWGRRRDAIAEKSKSVSQAQNGMADTETQILFEVALRHRKWREANMLVKANRTACDAAIEQLRVAKLKFGDQASLLRDVMLAEAQSTDANYQYQQSLAAYWSAQADLKKALGEE